MNNLLFRVWNKKEGKWDNQKAQLDDQYHSSQNRRGLWVPEYCELQLATGLKDRNGREIFEGDLVKAGDRVGEVKWASEATGWDYSMWTFTGRQHGEGLHEYVELIGNKFENLELINE